jgi:hypothetical protein
MGTYQHVAKRIRKFTSKIMNELKEYRKKETLKKEFFKQLENSDLPYKTIIEMLEELINLYKN